MSRSLRKTPASTLERSSGTFWFVAKEKLLSGPFTFEQLLSELAQGRLDPGDYCWRQGFQEWRPLCSVEDFGFQVKPYVVRSYPQVPVPSAKPLSDAPGAKSSPTAQTHKAQVDAHTNGSKTVKVRLEPTRRLQVGLWERVGMVTFSILFAWASTWVALSEVEQSFKGRFERHTVGQVIELGDVSDGVAFKKPKTQDQVVVQEFMRQPASIEETPVAARTEFWSFQQLEPVLSAPGLEAFESKKWPVRELIQKPVGMARDVASDVAPWKLASGHTVEWNEETHGEAKFQQASDPIYIQPYELHGTWSATNAKVLHIRNVGYPGF
ncbi:MAG: DUF4339 domain-containing protein [Bdellovibrionota bacterium]